MKLSLIGRLKLRKTETNEKDIKSVIYISGWYTKENNNLKLEGMSGGKKK